MWTCERGDALELTLERAALGGDGVGQAPDGRVVFVRGGLPGDRVRVELVQVKKRFLRGALIERLAAGAARGVPACERVDACGGCPWMPLSGATQREILGRELGRMLARPLNRSAPLDPPVAVPPELAWRHTTRLRWKAGVLGYRPARSHRVLDIPECPVMAPTVAALYAAIRAQLAPALTGQGTLRISADDEAGTLALEPDRPVPGLERALARFVAQQPLCRGAVLAGRPSRRFGDPQNAFGPHRVAHPAQAFVQAHQAGSTALAEAVVQAAATIRGRVVELYAGSGHFTLALAAAGRQVTAVERQRVAAEALQRAAEERGLGDRVQAIAGDAADLPSGVFTVGVIDPPRAGARDALPGLHASGIRRLVYVSCEPSTFARDAGWLTERGWRAAQITPFDLFPHTGHVELVGVFDRTPGSRLG